MDRRALLLSMIDTSRLGLEIGAGYNPLLPKADGWRVETLDHAPREVLVAKYAGADVDTSRIEPVDHVSAGGSVFDAVGEEGRFGWIVASHVIEHTPDMVRFLLDCQRLLQPDGVLALAVPDKRMSFDALRPLTSTGDVLQAHLEGRTRHTPGRVFDEVAYNVLRGGALAWDAGNAAPLAFFRPLADAQAMLAHVRDSAAYIDIHAWQFTPSSFRLVAADLHGIGVLALRESAFHAGGGEFLVGLSRAGAGPGVDRLALAQRALAEQAQMRLDA
jgi:SAM-dependent methyltransferase